MNRNQDYYTLDEIQELLTKRSPMIESLVNATQMLSGADVLLMFGPDDETATNIIQSRITSLNTAIEVVEKEFSESDRPEYVDICLARARMSISKMQEKMNLLKR